MTDGETVCREFIKYVRRTSINFIWQKDYYTLHAFLVGEAVTPSGLKEGSIPTLLPVLLSEES